MSSDSNQTVMFPVEKSQALAPGSKLGPGRKVVYRDPIRKGKTYFLELEFIFLLRDRSGKWSVNTALGRWKLCLL